MNALTDKSPMPFGKHRGETMEKVPVEHLHWLWCGGKKETMQCPVADYIRRNLAALKKENPDLIWT